MPVRNITTKVSVPKTASKGDLAELRSAARKAAEHTKKQVAGKKPRRTKQPKGATPAAYGGKGRKKRKKATKRKARKKAPRKASKKCAAAGRYLRKKGTKSPARKKKAAKILRHCGMKELDRKLRAMKL